ncbi:AraC-type DNA-binding protein [Paenibacillus algorifonticola]|uniref:AraC-type DNA-binding protein n=1 Tax=Paenibacillus algorifonticola TaxID=684063 RepID=A0A1I2AAH6_9BACL|nr:AraC family transcriptional regulator [Paenibacillus algorifonticola]SFE40779.1 AraC-type DNA-binding protein [Paenibacillus algorifonticola]
MDDHPVLKSGETSASLSVSYLYILRYVNIVDCALDLSIHSLESEGHRIVAFAQSGGKLHLEGHSIYAEKGACFLLAPGAKAQIEERDKDGHRGAVYVIAFDAYRMGEREPALEIGLTLPYETRIDVTAMSRLVDLLEQAAEGASNNQRGKQVDQLKQQIRLQELLVLLMEHVEASHSSSDAKLAVQESIAYMVQHYREEMTVEQLSKMSGVARWQYSALFQTLTGKKPLDYLTELRLNRAKELLLLTDDPLREIARQAGFKDEYYFARRFRHAMGLTPKQYAKTRGVSNQTIKQDVNPFSRVVVVGYVLGDLLSLGIRPVGADMTVIGRKVVYRNELKNISDIGLLGELGKVKALCPDLILYSSFRQDRMEELSKIAPTVSIDRLQPTYNRLMQVAELFGKEAQAKQWIESYERKAGEMWRHLALHTKERETAAIFVLVDGDLYVMGMRGIALTLYHPMAFEPAVKVRQLIEEGIPFQAINLEQMSDYHADRLFLLVGESERSRSEASRIINSVYWHSFDSSRVYVTEAKWNFDDPITRDRLLPALPRIFRLP